MTARKDLTRDAILAAQDLELLPVEVPEWGGTVYVRRMTGPELDDWQLAGYALVDASPADPYAAGRNVRARLVLATACSADGLPLFRKEDLPALQQRAGVALGRVYEAARKHNGLAPETLDELEGKAEAAPSGDSATA